MLSIFLCTCWLFKCPLCKNVYSDPDPLSTFLIRLIFFFCYWVVMSSLYSLDNNPLSSVWFANIFCHSLLCLVILLLISFDVAPFVYFCFWSQIQKIFTKTHTCFYCEVFFWFFLFLHFIDELVMLLTYHIVSIDNYYFKMYVIMPLYTFEKEKTLGEKCMERKSCILKSVYCYRDPLIWYICIFI